MIVVEKRMAEIISYLPEVKGFKPYYHFGDNIELNNYIKLANHKVYPLIYQTSYQWNYNRKADNVSLTFDAFIAVQTEQARLNTERWEATYKEILLPTFENLVKAFEQSNIIRSDYNFNMSNHPNYGSTDTDSRQAKTIDIIDALRFRFDCTITNNCIIKKMIF